MTASYTLSELDFDAIFSTARHIYGYENEDLYNTDKSLFRQINKINKELILPIEEQDRSSYWLLKRHSENIESVLKVNNINIPNDIVLGTLPTDELNAVVGIFPKNQILIAFDQGLFQFLYLMGRVISSFFIITSKKDDSITVDFNKNRINQYPKNKESNLKFVEVMLLYFVHRDLLDSKIYFETDKNMALSKCLWDTAELFIASHEYSHIILGHLTNEDEVNKKFIDEESILHKTERSWKKKLAADELAFQITFAYSINDVGVLAGFLGVEFLFACFNIIRMLVNSACSR